MRWHRAWCRGVPVLFAAMCLLPAGAQAKRMSLGTALRHAATAPLPNVAAYTSRPPTKITVSGCRRRSSLAFVCKVEVTYAPVIQPGPVQTSAPAADYEVRVFYPTPRSTAPHARVVGEIHFVA